MKKWVVAALGGALALAGGENALAQSVEGATAAPEGSSEEIIVTARKREEVITDVPLSITAFSGEELQASGAENFEDYAARVPGLSFNTRGPTSSRTEGVTLGMRGVSGGLSDPPVGFYVDETPVGSVNLKLFDIDRVEILRGPQGTLYGARAMGGLIRIITNQADPTQFEANGGAEFSSTDGGDFNFRVDGAVNVPLIEDQLALRVSGYSVFRQGVIDRLPGAQNQPNPYPTSLDGLIENEDDEETYGGRASLAYAPLGSDLRIVAQYMHERASLDGRSEWDVPLSNALGEDLINGGFAAEPSRADFQNASLTVNYDFGNFATLTSNTSGTSYVSDNVEDFTYFISATAASLGAPWDTPVTNLARTDRDIFTQELRLTSLGQQTFDWQVGLFYQRVDQTGTFYSVANGLADAINTALGFPYLADDLVIDQEGLQRTTETGAFAEVDWHITDQITATVGLRYFENEYSSSDQRTGLFAAPTSNLSSEDDGVNPRYSLSYEPSDDLLLYASATKGFRRGGANNIVGIPPSCDAEINALGYDSPPASFESDNLWHYEVGVKGSAADRALQVEAAVFHIDWQDKQQLVFLPGCGFSLGANVGRSEIDGVEMSTTLRATDNLTLGLSAGYLDATVAEDTPQAGAFAGDRLPLAPEWTGSVYATYERPITASALGFGRIDVQYRDEVIESVRFTTLPDYVAVNLRGGVQFDQFTVTAFVDNVTNELGQLDSTASSLLLGQPDAQRVHTLTPRTFGVELRAEF